MKRLLLISAGVLAAAGVATAPAIAGLTDNPSFSHQIPIRVPSQAHLPQLVDDHGRSREPERGDDRGGVTRHAEPRDDRGGVTRHAEPRDDRGGVTRHAEPGDDDRDGRTTSTERGDDNGGHGGHGDG